MHIVDELIIERAPKLAQSFVWPVLRPVLNGVLGYKSARWLSDAIKDLSGSDALGFVSKHLALKTNTDRLDYLPKSGRVTVVCNHPTGIADGIAVLDAITQVRQDAIFFANADALRVCPRFSESLIPVEWVEAKRTREKTRQTLLSAKQAYEDERCVVVFPAGKLARKEKGKLIEPPWMTTAVSMSQKYHAPLVPMYLSGPNSFWFHAFDRISPELRDITLFHEFLNKRGREFSLILEKPIPPEALKGEVSVINDALKLFVESRFSQNRALFYNG